MNRKLQAVPASRKRFVVNAIIKINGVSGQGLAQLLQVIESDVAKVNGHDKVKTLEREPELVDVDYFRFVKILEVKPDDLSKYTYLVTFKVCLKVDQMGVKYFSRGGLVSIFSAIDSCIVPATDNGRQLEEMMSSLLSLEDKRLPYEIRENDDGGGRVLVEANTRITVNTILMKIFPRLEFVELHGYCPPKQQVERNEGVLQLFRARDIAKSLR